MPDRHRGEGVWEKHFTCSISCCSHHGDLGVPLTLMSPYKPQTRGPVRAHPWPYEFARGPDNQDSLLVLQLGCVSDSYFQILSHSTVLPPHSLNLRDTVSLWLLVVTSGLWEVISLPFCLLRWPEFEPRFLPVWCVSPHWFLSLTRFHCASEVLTPTHWDETPSGSSCQLVPGGISSLQSGGMHPGWQGRW
jgi:hypothetical protein